MSLNITKTLAFACGLALTVSALAGNAFARGAGGGHSSSGMAHSNGHPMTYNSNNFARTTPNNSMNRLNHPNNFTRVNTTSHFPNNGNFKNGGSKNQFQKLTMKKFSKSKSPFWKKYTGWGKYWGPWGGGFGWGWGCWDSPWCYGWCWYEPIPAVAYYNPYCDCAGSVIDGVDYSVPIASLSPNTVDSNDSDAFAAAREAFSRGDLDAALKAISVAVLQAPHNQDVHQFHSLVLFAMKDYCKSAAVAHAVLEEGPGWTWDTLQTFYASADVYTAQLRQLEHFVSEHPSDANVRYLLGYHYLMLNHADSAQRQLKQVEELEPKDKLAANIVIGMKTATTAKPAPVADKIEPAPKTTPVVNEQMAEVVNMPVPAVDNPSAASLTGTWKATPAKDVRIELTLRDDKTFTWKFTASGKTQDFAGKYELGANSLVLTRKDGESMDGTLERDGNAAFKFRMKDAESDDPGLSFSR
jgi:tetratricopeptide (TPR) repeat protein